MWQLALFAGMAVSEVLNHVLKDLIREPRPLRGQAAGVGPAGA